MSQKIEMCVLRFWDIQFERESRNQGISAKSGICGTIISMRVRRDVSNPVMVDPRLIDLSHYREIRHLGEGRLGNVYVYIHIPTGHHFALQKSSQNSFDLARRAQLMHQMTHPATLACLGFKLPSPDSPGCLLMEFMANGTLASVNQQVYAGRRPAAWSWTAISKAAFGLTAAMYFIHLLGLSHRSLCPAHIFLDE
jgi:serine/threonine protein kinase